MLLIEVGLLFLNFSMKKQVGFGQFLTLKNDFEGQNCAVFDLQF
jgi:hypothetical protein